MIVNHEEWGSIPPIRAKFHKYELNFLFVSCNIEYEKMFLLRRRKVFR